MVDVRLYKPVERCKIFVGTLLAFDEGTLTPWDGRGVGAR